MLNLHGDQIALGGPLALFQRVHQHLRAAALHCLQHRLANRIHVQRRGCDLRRGCNRQRAAVVEGHVAGKVA